MPSLSQVVIISRRVKRITLQRYLLSKLVFDSRNFDLRDFSALFENQLWLEKKVLREEQFSQKFGKSLEVLSTFLKELNLSSGLSQKSFNRFVGRIEKHLKSFYLPQRNFKSVVPKLSGTYQLSDSLPTGQPKKSVTQPTRLGKGYRDKGSARDLAKDGSPSWQEVATSVGPVYHKGRRIQ